EPVPWNEGQWVVGHARFTVITDTLVRTEYDAEERFVDAPSYFAVERAARFHHALFTRTESGSTIDTGRFVLTYSDAGQPFSETNLILTLTGRDNSFSPAGENPESLGGTTATLDGWSG